jgi:hypothetical protein
MNWYVARIVFKIVTSKTAELEQYDETLRIIMASSLEDQQEVKNNKKVKWEFVNVADICCIQSLQDGVEIYSSVSEHKQDEHYESIIHAKAESLHYLAAAQ